MAYKTKGIHNATKRATLLDVLHLAAIMTCTVWTAKLIVNERYGGVRSAAEQVMKTVRLAQTDQAITIRLDDTIQTAAQ